MRNRLNKFEFIIYHLLHIKIKINILPNKVNHLTMSFNIITGEILPNYPLNSSSRRFNATNLYRNKGYSQEHTSQLPKVRKLGTSKDSKAYAYGYTDNRVYQPNGTLSAQTLQPRSSIYPNNDNHSQLQPSTNQKFSLTNASKNQYDLINHTIQRATSQNQWAKTHKQNPISKFIHQGRLHAANHSTDYLSKYQNNPKVFGKSKEMCNGICRIQKSYGTDKFFRKYK